MSLFSCANCGSVENTALTQCGHPSYMDHMFKKGNEETKKTLTEYKEKMGLPLDKDFPEYCSACCPVAFDENGSFTTRINHGWHESFTRHYLPIGMFETNPNTGNLRKVGEQKDCENLEDYFIKEEP